MFGWDDFGGMEKGEKMVGRGRRRRENWCAPAVFPKVHKNLISTKWRENARENGEDFPSPNN